MNKVLLNRLAWMTLSGLAAAIAVYAGGVSAICCGGGGGGVVDSMFPPVIPVSVKAKIWYRSERTWANAAHTRVLNCVYPEVRSSGAGEWSQAFSLSLNNSKPQPADVWALPVAVNRTIVLGTTALVPSPAWCFERPRSVKPELYLSTGKGATTKVQFSDSVAGPQQPPSQVTK
jgi:hypothetical protein